MKKILVTGVGGPAGRSVASLLLARQYSVIGTDMQNLELPDMRFYQVPPASAGEILLQAIYAIALKEQVDLIIPTVSEELPVFSALWHWHDRFPVMLSSDEAIHTADDKYLTAQALSKQGVIVPRYCLPSHINNLEDIIQKIGIPFISKPRVGRGGREVSLRSKDDLAAVKALGDGYILQEFAPGTDFAPNVFLGKEGYSVVVTLEKTELKEGLVGNAKSVQRADVPSVAAAALAAARAVGLRGPLDIDIRLRGDGVPVVLEINARFGANIRHAQEVMDAALAEWID